jgi:hypothetical protein
MIGIMRQRWTRLTSRERLIAGLGAALAVASLVFVFALDPLLERLAAADRQLAAKQRALSELTAIAEEYRSARSQLSEIEHRIERRQESVSLLAYIEDTSKTVQVRDRIVGLQPQSLPPSSGYRETSVELRFDGILWPQLLAFVAALEESPSFIRIKRFQTKPRYDTPYLLEASLVVSSYDKEQ